ncbi:mis18-binding protein 1-like [Lycodopsis pacificus]
MALFHNLLQHTTPMFESPAKVFAKLKSKVQREAIHAKEDTFTGSDPLCNVRHKHGSVFKSPRKRAERTWMTDELKKNQRSGYYRNEVQALTLSPISSPEKSFVHPDSIRQHVKEKPPMTETRHGCTTRRRAFLESTALPHPSHPVNRKQIHTESPQTRDSGGFKVISRTLVDSDFESSVFVEGCAPLDPRMSPAFMLSPTRKMLKRKCEPQEFNRVTSGTKEVRNESRSQTQKRKTSRAFSGDNNTCTGGLGNVRGLSAASEANQFLHEPVFPSTMKHCFVRLEECPLSPAKMFIYMKKRESKMKQQEVHEVSSSRRDLFNTSDSHQSGDTAPPSTVHSMGEMEDIAFRSVPESVAPVNRSRVESADSLSDPSEDTLRPAVSPQPVSLEDPLVLNTPRISIPKKLDAVFKRNKLPQIIKFPSESAIYLKKWFPRRNHKGLFVDGIHQDKNIPWNSNIIVARVSNNVVKTVSGSVYILSGKMNVHADSGLPKWLLKKFANGFPPDWEALYERFLSESSDDPSRETGRNSEGGGVTSKTKSEASSVIDTVKRQKKKSFKAPDSSLPAPLSRLNVSRSGRVIKPPLEYWKGGRVLLDAHMNVTIHECYDTSICIPVSTTESTRASQEPPRVLPPCSKGRRQCESASDKEASGPLRRVKAPLRKRNSAKSKPENKPSYSPEPPVETLRSPEADKQGRADKQGTDKPCLSGRQTTNKSSTKQTNYSTRSSVGVLASKQAVPASSDEEVNCRRKSGKEVHRKGGRRALNKSRPSHVFPSSESSESSEIEKEVGKRTRVTQTKQKRSKSNKSSSPTKPLPKLTQTSKKKPTAKKGNAPIPQEHDADEWTEAELMTLQEAVSCYPMHIAGYWAKVARMVGTRSEEECYFQHTSHGTSQTPAKRAKRATKKKLEAPKDTDHPVISARAGTLKRKQQVRQFLEAMPREDVEDVFSSAYMQNKRFEMPSMSQSDQDFTLTEMEPLTPMSKGFPEVKTPQCLHISPGMMGSPNRSNDDKYAYRLQKRMKTNQLNVGKLAASSRSFTPTPSVRRTMRRCANTESDTFLLEMFPGNDGALSESGEEEDFYFSDND